MTVKAPSHDVLARMADDIAQLTRPIHVAIRGRVVTHLPLLDQLRDAAVPGASVRGPERRILPASRPPLRLDPVDALAAVYVSLSGWHHRLNLPSPSRTQDWQKAVLRALVGAAPALAPSIADWLAVEVHDWWTDCATGSGWRAADLLKLR